MKFKMRFHFFCVVVFAFIVSTFFVYADKRIQADQMTLFCFELFLNNWNSIQCKILRKKNQLVLVAKKTVRLIM